MIVWRFRGRASPFLSSRLFAKVTACRGRFASHSPIILQKSFLLTNIPIYAAEPFIFSIFARFLTSERPGSFNRPTKVVQSNGLGRSFGRPESFTYRKTLPREETNTLNALKPIDMAILYDWYENPGTNEEKPEERGLHPRPLLNGKVTMRQLYNRVHARSSLTVGDVMNAIDCLTQICGEELRDGHEVHIEGLGYFAPTLEATQKVTRSTPNKHLKLRLKSISFRPDVRLKQAMTGVSAIRSKYTRHSLKLSEVEIDMKLKEYFADHDVLIRSDFQALCGMARTTANVHLKRLQQEGKLKNVGKPTQPIYRAMPGYYGVSRDAKAGR